MGKRLLLVSFILLITLFQSFPQWSIDPGNPLIIGYGINPKMCSDGSGGCFVTYESGEPVELSLRWFNRYGNQPWGGKRILRGALLQQETAQMIHDINGGVIIAYEDRNPFGGSPRLRLQRVDTIGNFLWGPIGVKPSIADTMQSVQRIVSDGNGGCVIAWIEHNIAGIYRINRINSFGERVWSETGLYLTTDGYSHPEELIRGDDGSYYVYVNKLLFKINPNGVLVRSDTFPNFFNAIADGFGGLVIYNFIEEFNLLKLYASRIDSNGTNLWVPQVFVSDSLYYNPNAHITKNQNYFVLSWAGKKNGVDQVSQLQMLRIDGSKVFSESIPLRSRWQIMASDSMRTMVISRDSTVQCYDTLGNKLFNGNGAVIANPYIDFHDFTTDGMGGVIVTGEYTDFSIVVQKMSRNGICGEVLPVELTSFTGEIHDNNILLRWVTASETNNKGFEVERITNSVSEVIGFVTGRGTTTEKTNYSFEDNDDLHGIKKYRLKQIDYNGNYEYSPTIEIEVGTPDEYSLSQNYPNPFNSTTIIRFTIPHQEEARLSIYNILGQEIETIVKNRLEAGIHKYDFNASFLTSGVYFYRLQAGSFTGIKKFIVLK